jgi:lipoyl-dependent peroxiredoxin
LNEAGFTADELTTEGVVTFENGAVTESHLILKAKVPGISKEKFDASVKDAELNCPISKLLKTTISVEATLL